MKNIKIISALFILLFAVSCNDEEYIAPDTLSDVAWYVSIMPGSPYNVVKGKSVSFIDASIGTLSHEWIIEDGAYYLKKGFETNDSLPLFIDTNLGFVNKEKAVFILFTKVGPSKVRLYNTYSEPVTYRGTNQLKAKQDINNPNIWVIDTTFVFNVTEPVVVP